MMEIGVGLIALSIAVATLYYVAWDHDGRIEEIEKRLEEIHPTLR